MKYLKNLLLAILLCTPFLSRASHIIGGEVVVTCLGGTSYQVTLILYRDCTSLTPFDNPAYMSIYTQSGDYVGNFTLTSPLITGVPAESDNPCLDAPDDICVEQAIYTKTITLADSDEGYILVYQRCCRNAGIVNIISPDATGGTYTQEVPPTGDAVCNNSPIFTDFPPTVICVGDPIVFDHSAIDPDGDSLVYQFYHPYEGASAIDPAPTVASPPPYGGVAWVGGYDETYPIDATPAFAIDPETGILTGTATSEGRYVVGIMVKEYRDGVWLGDHIRDFQFNVVACTPTIVAQMDIAGIIFDDTDPDVPYLNCQDFLVNFDNFSIGGDDYFWDFGDGSTSTEEDPSHIYADTGTYFVTLIVNPGFVCADTAIAEIHLYNTLTADYDFDAGCSGIPVVFDDQSVSTEAGDIISWDWDFADGSSSSDENPEHEYSDGGDYPVVLTVTTDKGCVSTVTYNVNVEPGPHTDFVVSDVCQNEPAAFNNLTTILTGTITGYDWDFGDGSSSTEEEPFHFYDAPGDYTVTLIAYSANGCTDTSSYDIHIGELPFANAGADDSTVYLEGYTLNGSGVGTFLWFPGNPIVWPATISSLTDPNPEVHLTETTTFILTVTSPDGCTETDTVTIYVKQITIVEVPNAFSPNGDGINDEIFVLNHEVAELLEYSIYNRWGELVFTTTDINRGWNGKVDGEEAAMGTYVYLVRAIGLGGEEFVRQGNITLVR
ncbi:MAG: PKD domain-containing protein [Chitinophagales bacterium]